MSKQNAPRNVRDLCEEIDRLQQEALAASERGDEQAAKEALKKQKTKIDELLDIL